MKLYNLVFFCFDYQTDMSWNQLNSYIADDDILVSKAVSIRESLVKLQDHILQSHLKKLFIIESSLTDGLSPSPKDHDSKICSHLYNIHNIYTQYNDAYIQYMQNIENKFVQPWPEDHDCHIVRSSRQSSISHPVPIMFPKKSWPQDDDWHEL